MTKRLRVVVADDHPLFRAGIRRMLEDFENLEVVGEASDGLELLSLVKTSKPDLVLLDISMPNMRGIEATGEVLRACPEAKVLIVTMHENREYLYRCLSAGASGYLLKQDADTELGTAITEVVSGGTYISPHLSEEVLEDVVRISRGDHPAPSDPLTPRERQVLTLIAEGKSNRQIGETLFISSRTAEHHRASLMRKLKLKNTAELVRFAVREGYTG